MRSTLLLVVLVAGCAGTALMAGQTEMPAPPAPPAAPPIQLAPRPAPPPPPAAPQAPQVQVAPWPAMPPAPPTPPAASAPPSPWGPPLPPPAPPAAPFLAQAWQAPGILLAPQASQSYLGVHLIEVSQERARELGMNEPYGVEIMSVAPGSPADDAGVQEGDVLVDFRGQRVEGQEQLVRLVRETPVGREVEIGVLRNGSKVKLNVEIGEIKAVAPNVFFNCGGKEPCEITVPSFRVRPFDFDIPKPRMVTQSRLLGVELEPLEGQLAGYFGVKDGVLVRAVESNSPASRAGLKAGDAIVEVAGRLVRDSGQIREAMRTVDPGEKIDVAVVRNRSRLTLQMEPQSDDNASRDRPARRVGRNQQF